MHYRVRRQHLPFDVGEQLAHQPGAFIPILHLFFLHLFENARNKGVQGYRKDHDSHANKRGPAEKVVKRNKRKSDLVLKSGTRLSVR